ncbi:hypothetical protein G6L85_11475 [Agrobacterium rhizogenes]|uniref:hypothetical protein n=1 Tax=Rhizobium rhizogenes TaxID=359 RepID=UPI0015737F40|nr:hypothetical protein [Rhizobium rhizogenes]NTI62124.1 hypothetical protein [Rhizobium rhizogenes]
MATRHDGDPKALLAARRREAAKPGRQKTSGRGSGLTPRVRKAVEAIVYGVDGAEISTMKEAAGVAGLSDKALRDAFKKPSVLAHYRDAVRTRQEVLKARAVDTLEGIMTDKKLMDTPTGGKVRLDAAKAVLQEPASAQVNVQVNNTVSVTPGYVIRIDRSKDARGRQPVIPTEENDLVFSAEEVLADPPYPKRSISEDF